MPASDIPIGSEFGPNQVDLVRVLQLLEEHAGDPAPFDAAIAAEYHWPIKTARNTRLSLGRYKLRDDQCRPTELARRLLALREQPTALYAEFARHILLELHGMEVVTVIHDMIEVGETRPTQLTISAALKPLGVYASPSSTHISKMIGWLHRAGIFRDPGKYESLDMARVHELLGATDADVNALAELQNGQRAVLKALVNLPMTEENEPLDAAEVRQYAEAVYGEAYNPKNFPREVLLPLQEAGYITLVTPKKKTGEEAGQRAQVSGKSLQVLRNEKLFNDYLPRLVDSLANTGLAVRKLMRKPLAEIIEELSSADRNIKGKALEALAFYLTRLLDLEFRSWRKRAKDASGFEVDLIVEGARLIFSRWQIQCKNSSETAVSLEDVAKEVGISLTLKSNVILVVTTGRFSREARSYADDIMASTHLNIVLLNKADLAELTESPLRIVGILNSRARRVMALKKL